MRVVTRKRAVGVGAVLLVVLATAGGALLLTHHSSSSLGKPPERLCTQRELATKTFQSGCVYRVGSHWEHVDIIGAGPLPSVSAVLVVRVFVNRCAVAMAGTCTNLHRRYSLRCDPARGTLPGAASACLALTDLITHRYHGTGCTGPAPYGGPSTARIAGLVNHHPYALDLQSDNSWCGHPPRALLRDYWALSTFPCTVNVLHEREAGAPSAYPQWAHWAGCRGAPDTLVYAPPSIVTLIPAGIWGRIWESRGVRGT